LVNDIFKKYDLYYQNIIDYSILRFAYQ